MEDEPVFFIGLSPRVFFHEHLLFRLYRFVEDAYTYGNRTLLCLLLPDQQLAYRLRMHIDECQTAKGVLSHDSDVLYVRTVHFLHQVR